MTTQQSNEKHSVEINVDSEDEGKHEEPKYIPPKSDSITLIGHDKSSETKLKVYSSNSEQAAVMEAMGVVANKEMPSNAHISYILDNAKKAIDKTSEGSKDAQEAKTVVKDIEAILHDTKEILLDKNSEDRLQKIIHLSKIVFSEEVAASSFDPKKGIAQTHQFKIDAEKLAHSLKNIIFLMIGNKDFRTLLVDFVDIVETAIKNTAGKEDIEKVLESVKADIKDNNKQAETTKDAAKAITHEILVDIKSGKGISDEQMKELQDRLKILLRKITASTAYRKAMRDIINIVSHLKTFRNKATKSEEDITKTTHEHAAELVKELEKFLEHFTGVKLRPVLDGIKELRSIAKKDEKVKKLLKDFETFVEKTGFEPEHIQEDSYFKEGKELLDRAIQSVRQEKDEQNPLRQCLIKLFKHVREHLDGIKKDEHAAHLARDVQQLGHDLFFDMTGAPSLKHMQETLRDLKRMYLPYISNQLKSLAVPKIEGQTKKVDFLLEHLNLKTADILPSTVHIKVNYDMKVNLKEADMDSIHAVVTLEMKGISQKLENLSFRINVKPNKFHDEGTLSADIQGMDLAVTWRADFENDKWNFAVEKTYCKAKKLKLKVLSDKHNILDSIGTSVFGGVIKKKITETIREKLLESGNALSAQLSEKANTTSK